MKLSAWYNSRFAVVIFHSIAWLLTLFLPVLLRNIIIYKYPMDMSIKRSMAPERRMPPPNFGFLEIGIYLIWILLFYLNVYHLLPKWFKEKKFTRYIVFQFSILVLLLHIIKIIVELSGGKIDAHMLFPAISMLLFPFLFVQAAGITFFTIREKIKADQLTQEQENEQLKSELSFLRSQISPHFIFNVLNNMVSLARKKSDRLEPALIELSGLMRYMLYESDEAKVLVSKEINYLKNYIELQVMRFSDEINISTKFPINTPFAFIEPMMLIPFVENAFKHVNSADENAFIDIRISYEKNKVELNVSNSFSPKEAGSKDDHSGIGLQNVKRRLNLLYPSKHCLNIEEDERIYTVLLHLTIL